MVKDNEETNVKLLLCVHIGVSLSATLVLCLDMSSKTNQPTIRTTTTKPKQNLKQPKNPPKLSTSHKQTNYLGFQKTTKTKPKKLQKKPHLPSIKGSTTTEICVIGY